MSIQVYDIAKAPKWVQWLNTFNLILLGFAFGKFLDYGFSSTFVHFFTLYSCLFGLIVGQFFIPKKKVSFPLGFIQHLKNQWSTFREL